MSFHAYCQRGIRGGFWGGFLRTLVSRPGAALAALGWHLTGRHVRARNRLRLIAEQSPHAYRRWIATIEAERPPPVLPATPADPARPLFSVIADAADARSAAGVRAMLAAQSFSGWELIVAGGAASLAEAVRAARGAFLLVLPAGAVLPAQALARYAEAIAAYPDADVLYADQDVLDAAGRRTHPWLKPAWNPEMFLAQDYLSGACVMRAEVWREALEKLLVDGLAASTPFTVITYAALLAITHAGNNPKTPPKIHHLAHVLAHLPAISPEARAREQAARVAVVARHLARQGARAHPGDFGSVRVEWPLPEACPLVSILIPTRDRLDLLQPCVTGVLEGTDYPHREMIIIDNGSVEPATREYLAALARRPEVRVLHDEGPYNFPRLNNHAAAQARGAYLCLLNNDIVVLSPDWLDALMRQAIRPGVGAVGAKLLYDDGTLQHAGVVIGMGDAAGHAHRFQRDSAEGWFAQAHIAREASAVTAACLVVEKAKFAAVGGLDEDGFPVAFNDVDLCLKLRAAGWRNLYEPAARLIHHESKSRGHDSTPDQVGRYRGELALLQARWRTVGHVDPLFHPMLDASSETYLLRL